MVCQQMRKKSLSCLLEYDNVYCWICTLNTDLSQEEYKSIH